MRFPFYVWMSLLLLGLPPIVQTSWLWIEMVRFVQRPLDVCNSDGKMQHPLLTRLLSSAPPLFARSLLCRLAARSGALSSMIDIDLPLLATNCIPQLVSHAWRRDLALPVGGREAESAMHCAGSLSRSQSSHPSPC
jgi:hypothetical protein